MTQYPHGSLPGELAGNLVHIRKRVWWLLHQDPGFDDNWKSSKIDRPYHIAVACLTRGLTHDEMMTVLRIWHGKHNHTLYEKDFVERVLPYAADYATPFVCRYESNDYWKEVRRIEGNPKARHHAKLRVAYVLMNTTAATARDIQEKTGIRLKTVQNSLQALQADGKVVMTEFGVYRAVQSFHWDHAMLVGTIVDGYVWDDDHPAMYVWGQEINRRRIHKKSGALLMECYDYCRDKFATVVYEDQEFRKLFPHPDWSEWVINEHGQVVENGTGHKVISLFTQFESWDIVAHRNGDNLDFRHRNLVVLGKQVPPAVKDEDVDYYGRLCAGCP